MPGRAHQQSKVTQIFLDHPDLSVIQAPAVFTLSQWVADRSARIDLLSGRAAARNADQLFMLKLWSARIRESLPKLSDMESFELARKAREADRMIRHWCLQSDECAEGLIERQFETWRTEVHEAMKAGHWYSNEDWHEHLLYQVGNSDIPGGLLPSTINLSGFVEFTRLEENLFDALRQFGITIKDSGSAEYKQSTVSRQCFESLEHEISAAAKWAADRVESGSSRVAVIVHDLARLNDKVKQVFEDEFVTAEPGPLSFPRQGPFSITSINSLANEPLVRDAFLLMKLSLGGGKRKHDFFRISRFLRSANYAGGLNERFERGQLELLLRKQGVFRLSLNSVAEWAGQSAHSGNLKILISQINGLKSKDPQLSPAEQLLDILIAWGWPGDGPQGESTRSVSGRLLRQLETLSRHSFTSAAECLTWLKRSCETDTEDAPGGALSPIQVMSVEEAQERVFDSARVLNFTLGNWPGRPYNNPFLNAELLRDIPRANENGMLAYAQQLTQSLKRCAPEVIFSWCDRLDDQAVSCSPLINDLPLGEHADVLVSSMWRKLEPAASAIHSYQNHPWLKAEPQEQGVAFTGESPRVLRSAVRFLNYQSASPLGAYMAFRLGAQLESMPQPFESGAYRGELVHAALEQLFRPLRGSKDHPAPEHIASAVDLALDYCSAGQRLLPVEVCAARNSLVELLGNWIEFEGQWEGGQVQATEWRGSLEFEGFLIDVRIDRINHLADGSDFLLDYKTGADTSLKQWAEGRLGKVQLPLYAVLLAQSSDLAPSGIAMAFVRPNEMKFAGLSGGSITTGLGISAFELKPGPLAKKLQSWDAALDAWSVQLAELLSEIRKGECTNQLFDEEALAYADLQILLRREEGTRWLKEVS